MANGSEDLDASPGPTSSADAKVTHPTDSELPPSAVTAQSPVEPGPAATTEPAVRSNRRLVIGGAVWIGIAFALEQVIRIVSTSILSRWLYPEAFGILALNVAFLTGLALFSDLGVRLAVIQSPRGEDPRFLDTAFTVQFVRGLILWGFAAALAYPAAYWRPQPMEQLLWLLPMQGFCCVLDGLISMKLLLLHRRMEQRKAVMVDLGVQFSAVIVQLVAAYLYPTALSLVIGPLTGSAVRMIASHFLIAGRRDRFAWDRDCLKSLSRFTGWTYFSTVCTFFAGYADRFVIGVMSMSLLGVFHFAVQFAMIPIALFMTLSSRLLFPYYSRLANAGEDLTVKARRPHLLGGMAGGFFIGGVASAGPYLTAVLYDHRYANAAIYLPLLCLGGWFQILQSNAISAMFAQAQVKLAAVSNLAKCLVLMIGIPIGTYYFGLMGLIAAGIIGDVIRHAVTAIGMNRRGFTILRDDLIATIPTTMGYLLGVAAGWAVGQVEVGHPRWSAALSCFAASAAVTAWWLSIAIIGRRLQNRCLPAV